MVLSGTRVEIPSGIRVSFLREQEDEDSSRDKSMVPLEKIDKV